MLQVDEPSGAAHVRRSHVPMTWGTAGKTARAVKSRGLGTDSHPPLGRPCLCSEG